MLLLVMFVTPSVPQQCSRPVRSRKGKYLSGHVMLNGSADGLGDCLINCSFNPRCKSINFRLKDLLCELNQADRYTHPWDYGSKEGHAYSDYPFKVITIQGRCQKQVMTEAMSIKTNIDWQMSMVKFFSRAFCYLNKKNEKLNLASACVCLLLATPL